MMATVSLESLGAFGLAQSANGSEPRGFSQLAVFRSAKLQVTVYIDNPCQLNPMKWVTRADAKIPNPPPESAGLEAVAHGFRNLAKDDFDNMRIQFPTYDALYKYCQLKTEGVQKLEYNVAQPAR